MTFKIVKTDSFQRDLDAVICYLVKSLENKIAAASLLDDIVQSCDYLKHMPLMYEACRAPHLKELGYRKAVIRNYVMVYKVDETEKTVYLMRFFHGRQNYEKQI